MPSSAVSGPATHLGVTIRRNSSKNFLEERGYTAVEKELGKSYGKTSKIVYEKLTTDNPIDLVRYQVANCYMGRCGLINSGGESKGASDLAEAVRTAVINKRGGGTGLISGRKAFQRPMNEGVELLNATGWYLRRDHRGLTRDTKAGTRRFTKKGRAFYPLPLSLPFSLPPLLVPPCSSPCLTRSAAIDRIRAPQPSGWVCRKDATAARIRPAYIPAVETRVGQTSTRGINQETTIPTTFHTRRKASPIDSTETEFAPRKSARQLPSIPSRAALVTEQNDVMMPYRRPSVRRYAPYSKVRSVVSCSSAISDSLGR